MIPSKFKLFASEISIEINNQRCADMSAYGVSMHNEGKIILADMVDGKELPHDIKMDTYYHEKVHIILDYMGKHELSSDEVFVDTFGKLLRQSDESAE